MDDEAKTAGGRRQWQQWTEQQARAALEELARSGMSVAAFARGKGISTHRIAYWKKRLAQTGPTAFVAVPLPAQAATERSHIEIAADGVAVRVREDLDVEHLARIVDALARRTRC